MAPPAATGAIPPPLPPSVEAAYRKKCIQLKQRLNEIESGNDESRTRIQRLNRAIQKSRLERAFLLEQLAKRTSTNVEDSEGSPSPPPTPKEKPLRTKRGHRKPDFLTTDIVDGRIGNPFIHANPSTLSPSSDAFSHTHPDPQRNSTPQAQVHPYPSKRSLAPANGIYPGPSISQQSGTPSKNAPNTPFDLYVEENRALFLAQGKPVADDIDAALARGWSQMSGEQQASYSQRLNEMKNEREARTGGGGASQTAFDGESGHTEEADEDVEMGEGSATPGATASGGFTAVNN